MMDQKQLKNVKYFNCLCNVITNAARMTRENTSRNGTGKYVQEWHGKIRPGMTRENTSRNGTAKQHLTRSRIIPPSKLDLNLRKKLIKGYILSIAVYGAENGTFWKVDENYLEFFDMWCWRRMKIIRWADHVSNEVLIQSQGGE